MSVLLYSPVFVALNTNLKALEANETGTFVMKRKEPETSGTFIYKGDSITRSSPPIIADDSWSASGHTEPSGAGGLEATEEDYIEALRKEIIRLLETDMNTPDAKDHGLGIVLNSSLFDRNDTGFAFNPLKIRIEQSKGGNSTKALFQIKINQKYITNTDIATADSRDNWRTIFIVKLLDADTAEKETSDIRKVKDFFKEKNLPIGKNLPGLTFEEKIISILGEPALVLHAARGQSLEDYLNDENALNTPEKTSIFYRFGQTLANFHRLYSSEISELTESEAKIINYNRTEKHPTSPEHIDEDTLSFRRAFNEIGFKDLEEIKAAYQAIINNPTGVNKKYLNSIIHGDAHAGNIFYNPVTNKITFIDNASFADSLPDGSSAGYGGSIASDVAYSIVTAGYFWRVMSDGNYDDFLDLASHFLTGYLKEYPKDAQEDLLAFMIYKTMVWVTFYKTEVPSLRTRTAGELNVLVRNFPSDLMTKTLGMLDESASAAASKAVSLIRKSKSK